MIFYIILGVIFLFIVYFEFGEMSLVASEEARLSRLARVRGGRYKIAKQVRERSDILFSTVLAGINLGTVFFTMLLTRKVGILWGLIISTFLISIIGEVLVKSISILKPEEIASVIAPPLIFFYWLFIPLIFLVRGIGDGILYIFGIKGEEREKITKEEMKIAVREARATGSIEPEQYFAMHSIARLSNIDVRDIMIPRVEIRAIDIEKGREEAMKKIHEVEVSKLPVYRGNIDRILGILFKEDIIGYDTDFSIKNKLRPVKFIHGDRTLEEALTELLDDKNGCAIVIDEYGGTEGFVSTDDILFSVFESGYDLDKEEENVFIVDGSIRPQHIGIKTDEDTIAGYIVRKLEEIPSEGTTLKVGDIELRIIDATERKIRKVLIKKE